MEPYCRSRTSDLGATLGRTSRSATFCRSREMLFFDGLAPDTHNHPSEDDAARTYIPESICLHIRKLQVQRVWEWPGTWSQVGTERPHCVLINARGVVADEKPDRPTDAEGRLTDPYNACDESWASAEQASQRRFAAKVSAPHPSWLRRFIEAIGRPASRYADRSVLNRGLPPWNSASGV
jgi:hypothetical protein